MKKRAYEKINRRTAIHITGSISPDWKGLNASAKRPRTRLKTMRRIGVIAHLVNLGRLAEDLSGVLVFRFSCWCFPRGVACST